MLVYLQQQLLAFMDPVQELFTRPPFHLEVPYEPKQFIKKKKKLLLTKTRDNFNKCSQEVVNQRSLVQSPSILGTWLER